MNVLSLFDGISCARLAFDNLDIPIKRYFTSEIDRFCELVSKEQWPGKEMIRLGNVTQITKDNIVSAKRKKPVQIDILIGGSPCTNLSNANIEKKGLQGEQSKLFYEFIRIWKEIKPKYFIFENVGSMSEINKDKISEEFNVEPIELNSMYFTPQRRRRFFWTNIPVKKLPLKHQIKRKLREILEGEFGDNKTEPEIPFTNLTKQHYNSIIKSYSWQEMNINKPCSCLMASYYKQNPHGPYIKCTSSPSGYRLLSAIECERLQGIPDNYTKYGFGMTSRKKPRKISRSQRYKMLGNAFTIPVIEYILSFL